MKLENAVIVTKGLCFLVIGFFTPMTVGLAQWANTGEWPSRIIWIVMGASCAVGAASQLLAFLSQSFGDWKAQRPVGNGNGNGNGGVGTTLRSETVTVQTVNKPADAGPAGTAPAAQPKPQP
jgi:hypothetical protein